MTAHTTSGADLLHLLFSDPALRSAVPAELDHICCCNPAKALCGAFVAGQTVKFGGPETAKNPCQECFNRAADGERCGAPDCPGGEA
jgi:hypothetical protein